MGRAMRAAAGLTLVGMVLNGCSDQQGGSNGEAGIGDEATPSEAVERPMGGAIATEYAPGLGVALGEMTETPSGLRYRVVEEGSGETAESGDTVVVHYTGYLPDGTQFDSSRGRDEPFQFLLGAGRVIPGWDEGVAGMKVGEQRKLVVPPDLGYGAQGAGGVIPPNATLVFDVELLQVR